jgi:hypothetical protein
MIDGRLRTKTDSSTDRYVDCEMRGKQEMMGLI